MARPVTEGVSTDARLLRLAADDNVLIVTRSIRAGEAFFLGGAEVAARADLPIGFKVAATAFRPGDVAIRLNMPIGCATQAIRVGELVHTHNLASQYMRTHERGEA